MFDCVSHDKWLGMYHGVTDLEIEVPLVTRGNQEVGSLRFPEGLGRLREMYILSQYEAKDRVSTQMKGTDLSLSMKWERGIF
jgi:hypothetical protein